MFKRYLKYSLLYIAAIAAMFALIELILFFKHIFVDKVEEDIFGFLKIFFFDLFMAFILYKVSRTNPDEDEWPKEELD